MTHFLKKMLAAWFILGSVSVGFAQQQMPPIPTDPNVRIGKLDNGMTYYIRHNELPENTGYEDMVNSITAKDLQEFAKALLNQKNQVEVSMTSEETK